MTFIRWPIDDISDLPRFFRKKDEPLFFPTVISSGNVFSIVITSGNVFSIVLTSGSVFNFSKVSVDDVLKEINKLDYRKAIQNTDIPVKILKQNADIFGSYICHFFNGMC